MPDRSGWEPHGELLALRMGMNSGAVAVWQGDGLLGSSARAGQDVRVSVDGGAGTGRVLWSPHQHQPDPGARFTHSVGRAPGTHVSAGRLMTVTQEAPPNQRLDAEQAGNQRSRVRKTRR